MCMVWPRWIKNPVRVWLAARCLCHEVCLDHIATRPLMHPVAHGYNLYYIMVILLGLFWHSLDNR